MPWRIHSRTAGRGLCERRGDDAALVEQLRDAVGVLACRYERLANGDLDYWPAVSLGAALSGKPG
jgi:hypothetical protein